MRYKDDRYIKLCEVGDTIYKKRRLLKEYEKILNKKLNLENHIIFK